MKSLLVISFAPFLLIANIAAAADIASPPFTKGEKFNLTRGYNTEYTHARKEKYALDFAQSGCASYGKPVHAIGDGEVIDVNSTDKEGNGFGFFVKIQHLDGTISRYAHLSKTLVEPSLISAGDVVGLIGNSGNVVGYSCREYPGTHLHFVMYKDGQAYRPEPMQSCTTVSSGATPCVNFAAGEWYRHDAIAVAEEQKK